MKLSRRELQIRYFWTREFRDPSVRNCKDYEGFWLIIPKPIDIAHPV